MNRLQHDVAFAAAKACVEAVAPALMPGEHRDAFEVFYEAISAALIKYDQMREHEMARLCKKLSTK